MEVLWPGFSPHLIPVLPTAYIFSLLAYPWVAECTPTDRTTQSEASGTKVPAQGRYGEEIHKCLKVTGRASASYHRDPPTEFLWVLRAWKERAEKQRAQGAKRGSRREKPRSPGART